MSQSRDTGRISHQKVSLNWQPLHIKNSSYGCNQLETVLKDTLDHQRTYLLNIYGHSSSFHSTAYKWPLTFCGSQTNLGSVCLPFLKPTFPSDKHKNPTHPWRFWYSPKGHHPQPHQKKSNFICGKNSQVHKGYSLSGKTSLSFALKSFHNIKTGISLLSPNIIIITLNMLSSLYCEEEVKEVLTSVSPTFENLMIEICRNQIKNRNMKRYPPSLHL